MGVALGILLGLAGSLCINTGNNLQSLGMHKMRVEEGADEEPNLCKSSTWVTGTVIFVTGALLNFASYGFAPQSTLASLESIQFVSNLFFGWWLLEKKITKRMVYGTGLTVGGTVLAVVFSSKEAAEIEDVDDLVDLWDNEFWITYVVLLVVSSIALQLAYKRLGQSEKKNENVMAVIYAVVSALFGTLSVVFAKLLAKFVELQAQGVNIFGAWYTYVTVISWLILMAFWLFRLNEALSLYNPLFIIPLLQANFILFAIVSGGIYFQEFNYMPELNWIGFVGGIILMFIGIALLVPPKLPESPRKSEDTHIVERKSTGLKEGCCRGSCAKLLMTGPARMYEQEFFEKMQQRRYLKSINEYSSVKNVNDKSDVTLIRKLYQNYAVADDMQKNQEELTDMLKNKAVSPSTAGAIKEKMAKWKQDKEDFKKNDDEINEIRRTLDSKENVSMEGVQLKDTEIAKDVAIISTTDGETEHIIIENKNVENVDDGTI